MMAPKAPSIAATDSPGGGERVPRRVLITSGPTREYIDTVRFFSNSSSGKMGYELARAAGEAGHRVTLISGPTEMPEPSGVEVVQVTTAEEMLGEAERVFADCDAAIMAAAVCDYRPVRRADHKQPKSEADLTIRLEPTVDICARLGATKGDRVLIGFAMEDHDHKAHAEAKLQRKGCDAIVLNSVSAAGASSGCIEVYDPRHGWSSPVTGTKRVLARAVVAVMDGLLLAR